MALKGISYRACLIAFVLALPVTVLANPGTLTVDSDEFEFQDNTSTLYFRGDVNAFGDFFLSSDELVVNFSDEAKGSGGKIEGVLALGGVCIEEAGKVIRGDRAEYFADENIILVTGGASAVECGDIVTADKIKLFLSTNNVVLMGGKGERVRASIRPTKDCDSEVAGEKFQCRRPR